MSKFKIGDHIKRDPSNGVDNWISGVIVGFRGNDYRILVTSFGDERSITIDFIDRSWVLDEPSIVDKILTKYNYEKS